jgi:hypothetical protein
MTLDEFQTSLQLQEALERLQAPWKPLFRDIQSITYQRCGMVDIVDCQRIRGEYCYYTYSIPFEHLGSNMDIEEYCQY